ncbi:YggT family protein [Candidatus Woesebacteria bacterium]|nr:YggT family protein [Candidatus Woesebacteria bacterium]
MQRMTYIFVSLIELLLSLRFIAKLFGANASASFIAWLYANTEPLLSPFQYVFPSPSVKGRFVLEFTTLFAIFMYTFLAYLVLEILGLFDTMGKKRK